MGEPELLAACYRNSLQLAVNNNLRSIAFPAISCGVYGYPIEEAVKVAVDTVLTFLSREESIKKVVFMLFSDAHLHIYEQILDHEASKV